VSVPVLWTKILVAWTAAAAAASFSPVLAVTPRDLERLFG
jgi:hypothetical protein